MILGFNIWDIIQVPFGYLLDLLYQLTTNYGVALILFSIIVKLILMPTTIKSKRSTMKMSRLTPKIQEIQKKYEGDQQKQSEAMQALYKEEGVSMGGGCLWSLVPLLILLPLYTVIREPIVYLMHESHEVATEAIKQMAATGLLENVTDYYQHMVTAANMTPELAEAVKTAIEAAKEAAMEAGTDVSGLVVNNVVRLGQGLNFGFLGIDLSAIPQWQVFNAEVWKWDWAHIGAFLLPVLSAGSQLVSMVISQKVNNSLVTNEKGVQDKEAAKKSQTNQTGKVMLYMMPVMTILIGYGMPAAMSLYWLIQGVVGTVMDTVMTMKLRKEYDAEDAARLEKAMEQERLEQEKEKIRAQRRAANPDGITENTSKKKLQQKQQREQEEAKAAAKKEFNARRGIVEEEPEVKAPLSGVSDRPYCKGRNYDPNRYASEATEEE